jgi:hypothetical protein
MTDDDDNIDMPHREELSEHAERVLRFAAERIDRGEELDPLVVASKEGRDLVLVWIHDYSDANKPRIYDDLVSLLRAVGADSVLWVADAVMSPRTDVRPLEDPAATEVLTALSVGWGWHGAERVLGYGGGMFPYHRLDDGSIDWDEPWAAPAGEGYLPSLLVDGLSPGPYGALPQLVRRLSQRGCVVSPSAELVTPKLTRMMRKAGLTTVRLLDGGDLRSLEDEN